MSQILMEYTYLILIVERIILQGNSYVFYELPISHLVKYVRIAMR